MRLGVIDVGSNTVHLLVVDAHRGAQPLPATSHKIELRLSEHVADDGHIQASGATALVEFVRECLLVAEDQGVEEEQRPDFYSSQVPALVPAGSVVLYTANVLHRVMPMTGECVSVMDQPVASLRPCRECGSHEWKPGGAVASAWRGRNEPHTRLTSAPAPCIPSTPARE